MSAIRSVEHRVALRADVRLVEQPLLHRALGVELLLERRHALAQLRRRRVRHGRGRPLAQVATRLRLAAVDARGRTALHLAVAFLDAQTPPRQVHKLGAVGGRPRALRRTGAGAGRALGMVMTFSVDSS